MMRALYSGVSGLKTHQTKFDVIGNNISNVNTVGFKASSVTFSDVFYQTIQGASGANKNTGMAGQNAMQVGVGVDVGSITKSIASPGSSQRTEDPFDVMINGSGFFIVNKGGQNYFTKAGNFKIDGAGNLATNNGATVMGWQVDPKDSTKTVADKVSELKIMIPKNMYSDPEATTAAYVTGNIDSKDTQLANGKTMQIPFYDTVGQKYTISVKVEKDTTSTGSTTGSLNKYKVSIADITDSTGKSILSTGTNPVGYTLGGTASGIATLSFDGITGKFNSIDQGTTSSTGTNVKKAIEFNVTGASPNTFKTISIDFSTITQFASSGSSALKGYNGDTNGLNAGKQKGNISGVSIDSSGKISASYDNGDKKLLGQIAVATFANPSGLEAVGNNMFTTTLNSGDFDGIGQDPSQGADSLTPKALEMSNVNLAKQFTEMITTQRGFQANSRIITTSDTLLEDLINLKR
jgi:flagellar hook protein FlgE